MPFAFCCVCCKKKTKEEDPDPAYAPVGKPNGVINGKTKNNTVKRVSVELPLLSSNNNKDALQMHNGGTNNVHRALPSLPEGGNLTRESSTSELYATVEKGANTNNNSQPDPQNAHTYCKIKPNNDVQPLYTKVDSTSRNKTWNVPPSRSVHQYEYPKFMKPVHVEGSVNDVHLTRDPVYSQVDNESGSETYTSVKTTKAIYNGSLSSEDPYKDPTYAYIPNDKNAAGTRVTVAAATNAAARCSANHHKDNDVNALYTKPNRRHSDAKIGSSMAGPSTSSGITASPAPPVPKKRLVSFGVDFRQAGRGGYESGSVPPTCDPTYASLPRREPSYKYITVRESLETLRARLNAQAQRQPVRTRSDPSLHYYATITSEHSYEIVPGSETPNMRLYEVPQETANHVTVVQIQTHDFSTINGESQETYGNCDLSDNSTLKDRPLSLLDRSFDSTDTTMRESASPFRNSRFLDNPPEPPTSPIPEIPSAPFPPQPRKSPVKNLPKMNNSAGNGAAEDENEEVHFGSITFGNQQASTAQAEYIMNECNNERLVLKTEGVKHSERCTQSPLRNSTPIRNASVERASPLRISGSPIPILPDTPMGQQVIDGDVTGTGLHRHSDRCSASPVRVDRRSVPRDSPQRTGGPPMGYSTPIGYRVDDGQGTGHGEESVCFCHCSNPQPEKVLQVNLEEMERSQRSKSNERDVRGPTKLFARF